MCLTFAFKIHGFQNSLITTNLRFLENYISSRLSFYLHLTLYGTIFCKKTHWDESGRYALGRYHIPIVYSDIQRIQVIRRNREIV